MENAEKNVRFDRVQRALVALQKKRPAYRQMLAFYGPLFDSQERWAEKIATDPSVLNHRPMEVQKKEGFPLLSAADFPLDAEAGRSLLLEICGLAKTAGGELAGAGEAVKRGLASGKVSAGPLLGAVLDPGETRLAGCAEDLGIDKSLLASFCYQAIRPSLLAWSRQLAIDPGVASDWDQGICPICGSPPAMALLEDEGRRVLVCGFCWHQWPHRRTSCPFCRTSDNRKLRYFFDENEPECRVDLCDECRRYLKTVDTRKTDRTVFPPLEALTTLHLDMRSQDMGFSGAGSPKDAS